MGFSALARHSQPKISYMKQMAVVFTVLTFPPNTYKEKAIFKKFLSV